MEVLFELFEFVSSEDLLDEMYGVKVLLANDVAGFMRNQLLNSANVTGIECSTAVLKLAVSLLPVVATSARYATSFNCDDYHPHVHHDFSW